MGLHPQAAAKQRAYRLRNRAGLAVYRLELPEVDVETMLADIGFLAAADVDDRDKVERALERFVAAALAEHLERRYR